MSTRKDILNRPSATSTDENCGNTENVGIYASSSVEIMLGQIHDDRKEIAQLRAEMEQIKAENTLYKESLSNGTCPNCKWDITSSHKSMNERSKEKIDHISNNEQILELSFSSMEEFRSLIHLPEPLCFQNIQHTRAIEASRATCVMRIDHMTIVKILMDVNQWKNVFHSIVSKASVTDVISAGIDGSYSGMLQMMSAEFHLPSPLIPTRESQFARYCKQHADGVWMVVDVSSKQFFRSSSQSQVKYSKRASGCLIQELPHGHSKVTWLERGEIDDQGLRCLYQPLVNAGRPFGANHWMNTLEQHARLASVVSTGPSRFSDTVFRGPEGRKKVLKVVEKMVLDFSNGVCASIKHPWTSITRNGINNIRVNKKSVNEPGKAPGIALNAATSFGDPASPEKMFNFLRDSDQSRRHQWDIYSRYGKFQEIAHVSNGIDPGHRVSLFSVNRNMFILQETRIDPTASYIIYAPVEFQVMNALLNGGDPDRVSLFPNGFAILPDRPTGRVGGIDEQINGGSLVTFSMEMLVDSSPVVVLDSGSVTKICEIVRDTIQRIKASCT